MLQRYMFGALMLLLATAALGASPVAPAGTRDQYPTGTVGYRPSIEWRTSAYGAGQLYRRTLWKVYMEQGESLLLASSAVGVVGIDGVGDILVFTPAQVAGQIGREVLAATPAFSCLAQRASAGNADRGYIPSRQAELAGMNVGYRPCVYQAPANGIYSVAILGPDGRNSDREFNLSGRIESLPEDYGPNQATSVTAWEIMVADAPTATSAAEEKGRVFAYYVALITGGNGRPIYNTVYVSTKDGFIYDITTRGADPFGFIFYSNRDGFLDTDGTPLYRNVMAKPTLTTQDQNQLVQLQGDVTVAPPEHPIFLQPPSAVALRGIGFPTQPIVPGIRNLRFSGPTGTTVTGVGVGGTFSFELVTGGGNFLIVVSRDGVNFDPTLPTNRVLYGRAETPGTHTIAWNGRDNVGDPFPIGNQYRAAMAVQGGEVHFPALDMENNLEGSVVTLLNPPGGVCPDLNGGCSASFYDDRGYETASGVLVGTALNGPLCPGNVGNPPAIPNSDPLRGYDSTSTQRGWGFPSGGNPFQICDLFGGFGDKKGLDRWAYYPSNRLEAPLQIVDDPTPVTLVSFTAAHTGQGVLLAWETAAELGTRGFYLYRAEGTARAAAERVTPELIRAQGSPTTGYSYSWHDETAAPDTAYTYWLVELDESDRLIEYPPARVVPLSAASGERIWLPLVAR